jgi:2',3'-cyclic-nucleotide 2'-phosphodiesterase (5'-nucleotidase family)
MEAQHRLKFVSANLRNGNGELLFEPWTVVERGGVKFAFISVIAPRYEIVTMTADNDEFVIEEPREAIDRYLPEMQQAADIVVLLAQMPSTSVREMLTAMGPGSGIDICIEGRDARQYRRINRVNGDVLLLAANNEGKYVGQLDLVLGDDKSIQDAVVTVHALDDNAPEISDLREKVDKFKAENGEAVLKVESFTHSRGQGDSSEKFLGVHNCARCHVDEARSYSRTKHAQAYNTLQTKGQQHNAECVSCHVVGFDWVNGFDQVADPNLPGRESLKNVQCEACHGYGTQHDRQGDWLTSARESCVVCHDQANSPDFDYESYWARIAH